MNDPFRNWPGMNLDRYLNEIPMECNSKRCDYAVTDHRDHVDHVECLTCGKKTFSEKQLSEKEGGESNERTP